MVFTHKHIRRTTKLLACIIFTLSTSTGIASAQQKERTLDEIKIEAIKRAENGMYPLIGLDPADVREAFAAIKTSDYDEWAAAFGAVADRSHGASKNAGRQVKVWPDPVIFRQVIIPWLVRNLGEVSKDATK